MYHIKITGYSDAVLLMLRWTSRDLQEQQLMKLGMAGSGSRLQHLVQVLTTLAVSLPLPAHDVHAGCGCCRLIEHASHLRHVCGAASKQRRR